MSDMSEKTPRYDVSRIGDNIASMRRNAGLTQEGLAFQLGISAQAVSKWERGVACPDMTLLPRLAVLFDVRIDALFLDGENPDGTLAIEGLPWDDDGELRVAVFEGKSLRLREIYACPDAGMVLLLHPTSSTNAEILGDLIQTWKREGYRFGSLSELCASGS